MADDLATRLGKNIRYMRDARGLTQQQMAKLSGLPRATWANLESGAANPTLAVLHGVAVALQVSLEELISAPRSATKLYARDALPRRTQGPVVVRKLLPERLPGMELERMEVPPGGRLVGVPHTPGTREYFTAEAGEFALAVAGERWRVTPGDVVVFRGDQKHSYGNPGGVVAVGYSIVVLAPVA